uniref:SSD domain-containing protein n=1 Tax=Branchiostoma floridae TaxID=7739 RepID=C3ZU95_BRAFL|eukprot:XP_002587970.1 hypothetical protein BRAFLDRAFT_87365 [Branchiostoma floridae]
MLFDCIEKNLKTWFGFFGCFVYRHEVFFLVAPLCVSGLLGAGLSHVRTDSDIDSLFSPYNAPARVSCLILALLHTAPARKERAALGGLFPVEEPWEYRNPVQHGEGNYVRVLLTSPGEGNILTERYLHDICAFEDGECVGEDFRRLLHVLDIGSGSLSYPVTMLEDGQRLFVGNLLGRIVPAPIRNLLTSVASAGAVQLLYYLRTNDSLHDHVSRLWEDEVEKKLLGLETRDLQVAVSTARTLEREYLENSAGISARFAGTVLLAVFAAGALCFTADCVRSKPLLGVGGVVTACFSGLASAGLISLCGGAFTTTLVPLPVLLLGSSLHDTYSMLSSWRQTSERDDVKTRMSETYQRAVVPMVFTYVIQDVYFTEFGPRIAVILRGDLRYWDPAVQDGLENLTRTFESIPHISAPDTDAWFRDYRAFLNTVGGRKRADKLKYIKRLRQFLNTTAFRRYRHDIVFKNNQKNIRASRIFLQSKKTANYKELIEVMTSARKVARESDLNVTVYNPAFMFLDQFAPILPEALENLGITGFCFLVFAMFTVTNFRSSMWVAILTMSVMTGLIGFLTVLGTNLDPATLGYSVFALGFTIQATSPTVFAFVRAQGPTRTKCMQSTLVYYSMPVVQTCLTLMFAVLPFTTAPSYIFYSLFQAVFTLCALVLLHALVVMPVIMTVVGPSKEEEITDSTASTPNKETSSGPYQVSAV